METWEAMAFGQMVQKGTKKWCCCMSMLEGCSTQKLNMRQILAIELLKASSWQQDSV